MDTCLEVLKDCVGGAALKIAQFQFVSQNVVFGFHRSAAEVQGHKLLIAQVKQVYNESFRLAGGQQTRMTRKETSWFKSNMKSSLCVSSIT